MEKTADFMLKTALLCTKITMSASKVQRTSFGISLLTKFTISVRVLSNLGLIWS